MQSVSNRNRNDVYSLRGIYVKYKAICWIKNTVKWLVVSKCIGKGFTSRSTARVILGQVLSIVSEVIDYDIRCQTC